MRLFGLLVMVFLSYYNHSTNKKSVPGKYTLACIRNHALPLPDQLTDCVTHLDVLVCLLFWRFTNFGHGLGI